MNNHTRIEKFDQPQKYAVTDMLEIYIHKCIFFVPQQDIKKVNFYANFLLRNQDKIRILLYQRRVRVKTMRVFEGEQGGSK